ncbi:MAG: hypothetical protein RJB50_501, partial [Actinomycetota bacterium]
YEHSVSRAIVNGSTTSALVSATDITKYQRDGVVVLRNVLTQNVIAELSDALAQNMQSPGPWANEYAANSQQGRFFDGRLCQLVTLRRLQDACSFWSFTADRSRADAKNIREIFS